MRVPRCRILLVSRQAAVVKRAHGDSIVNAPLAWHHSSGAPVHKSNKQGPKGRQQRYRLATTTIPGRDGDTTLKIGEDGLMGGPNDGGSVLGGVFTLDDSLAAVGGRQRCGI